MRPSFRPFLQRLCEQAAHCVGEHGGSFNQVGYPGKCVGDAFAELGWGLAADLFAQPSVERALRLILPWGLQSESEGRFLRGSGPWAARAMGCC